jgi:aminopeptidase N
LHDPWYYGEHLVYPLANFDVTLRFTDPANVPLIATSGEAETIDNGEHYILENGRDFALAMGRQLTSVSADVDGVTVTSYYYPGAESAGQAVLDATVKALQTYSALFGPYPHKTLAAVQGDFNDGMEFDGLYYLSNSFYNLYDGTDKNYLVMVAAHETSHQWWFGRVANDQSKQPWLDESLATYCEKLFYEKNYPDDLKWWWDYRINFYQPDGKIDGDVASYGGFTPYTNATYRQGARFMDELRQATGDEAFFAFLKDYATQMNGKIATADDFFRILRKHTQVDLSALLNKYFANPR